MSMPDSFRILKSEASASCNTCVFDPSIYVFKDDSLGRFRRGVSDPGTNTTDLAGCRRFAVSAAPDKKRKYRWNQTKCNNQGCLQTWLKHAANNGNYWNLENQTKAGTKLVKVLPTIVVKGKKRKCAQGYVLPPPTKGCWHSKCEGVDSVNNWSSFQWKPRAVLLPC